MLVTIAINNYNYAAYIQNAIDSALGQTYPDIEVIVVDDGSTDNSPEIIKSYGDKIRPFLKKNEGQVSAMNLAWAEAKGEIVMFLDADDVMLPEAIEKCVEIYKQGDYINVYYIMEKVDGHLKSKGEITPDQGYSSTPPLEDMKKWGYYAVPPTSSHTFRKSFLDKVMPAPLRPAGKDDDPVPMDAYLSTHAPLMGKLYFINEVLGQYRLHGNNKGSLRNNFSMEKLHRMFMRDIHREKIQLKLCREQGIDIKEDRVAFNPLYIKHRFLSYRLFPEKHPVAHDNFWYLLKKGLQAPFVYPYFGTSQKLKSVIAVLVIAFSPRFLIKYVLEKYYINSYRSESDKI